jgi:uncharacterized protein (DUF4415 family)
MNNDSSSQISDKSDDYPEITQADFDRATFRIGRNLAPKRQGVSIVLDANIVEYFKSIAGDDDYQSRINDTLREAVFGQSLEERLRRIIREEIKSAA